MKVIRQQLQILLYNILYQSITQESLVPNKDTQNVTIISRCLLSHTYKSTKKLAKLKKNHEKVSKLKETYGTLRGVP